MDIYSNKNKYILNSEYPDTSNIRIKKDKEFQIYIQYKVLEIMSRNDISLEELSKKSSISVKELQNFFAGGDLYISKIGNIFTALGESIVLISHYI